MKPAVKLRGTQWLVKGSWWPACQALMAVQHQASFCAGKDRSKGDPGSFFSLFSPPSQWRGEHLCSASLHLLHQSQNPSQTPRTSGQCQHYHYFHPHDQRQIISMVGHGQVSCRYCSASWCSLSLISSQRLHP